MVVQYVVGASRNALTREAPLRTAHELLQAFYLAAAPQDDKRVAGAQTIIG
jgi:hypothetical protein